MGNHRGSLPGRAPSKLLQRVESLHSLICKSVDVALFLICEIIRTGEQPNDKTSLC